MMAAMMMRMMTKKIYIVACSNWFILTPPERSLSPAHTSIIGLFGSFDGPPGQGTLTANAMRTSEELRLWSRRKDWASLTAEVRSLLSETQSTVWFNYFLLSDRRSHWRRWTADRMGCSRGGMTIKNAPLTNESLSFGWNESLCFKVRITSSGFRQTL